MEFQAKIEEWLQYDRNEDTRKEVTGIWEVGDPVVLKNRFGKRMSFGTAGLRATMGAGYDRINDLTIIQTTQGLAVHLIETFGMKEVVERGVVVGFDIRHNSERFAHLVTAVLVGKGIPVKLYSHYVPTPYVAYGVKKLKAIAGVMITASHNPKEDNGYKVCKQKMIINKQDMFPNFIFPSIAQLVERKTVVVWISLGPWFESGLKELTFCLYLQLNI